MADRILFPAGQVYDEAHDVMHFLAIRGEVTIGCRISIAALRECYGADTCSPRDAFLAYRPRIEELVRMLIKRGRFEQDGSILIRPRGC